MTEQKAIKHIKSIPLIRLKSKQCDGLEMAIKALEKQIPMKPKAVEIDMGGMDMETGEILPYILEEVHCSCCDEIVGFDGDIFSKYCPNCGQAIKWE